MFPRRIEHLSMIIQRFPSQIREWARKWLEPWQLNGHVSWIFLTTIGQSEFSHDYNVFYGLLEYFQNVIKMRLKMTQVGMSYTGRRY